MIFENYYYYFQEAIPKRICNDIIRYALTKKSTIGTIGSYENKNLNNQENLLNLQKTRNSNIVWLNDTWLYNHILPFVREANKQAGWNFDWDYSEDCQFTIYNKNQFYDWHPDAQARPYDNNRTPKLRGKIRKLSVTVSLSPAKDYKGGELEFRFPNLDTSKECKTQVCEEIKEQGSLVVFPSYLVHRVKPVIEGKRYSLVIWNTGNPYR